MKTIQVGKSKVKVLQFESLKEIQTVYKEKAIVEYFNMAFKLSCLTNQAVRRMQKRSEPYFPKEVKK